MTTRYTIDVDQAKVKSTVELFEFMDGNMQDAMRIAINKTVPIAKTRASKEIRDQVRLSASYVRGRLTVRKATRAKLSGAVGTPQRGLLLSRFNTNANIAGDKTSWIRPPLAPRGSIKLKIKSGGATIGAPGDGNNRPFYMVLNGGKNLAIAVRREVAGPQGGAIKVFSGPSISQVFNSVRSDILPDASDEFQAQMIDAMRYLLLKKNPPEAAV